jgi:uncharacterized protein (DUF2235 family)
VLELARPTNIPGSTAGPALNHRMATFMIDSVPSQLGLTKMNAGLAGQVASPKKRVIVCLDGTWNIVNDNTNAWRFKSLCAPTGAGGLEQRLYYSAGVGTKFGPILRVGMFGYGLNDEIIDAYEWLIENYEVGDQLFIFGFSRGAYTARSLSGLIAKCGLLTLGAPLSVKQLYDRYRLGNKRQTILTLIEMGDAGKTQDFTLEEQWILKYTLVIDIDFIGVWDTVGALGLPFGKLPCFGRADMNCFNTGLRVSNKFGFHALAIDEHRAAFAPTLWTVDAPQDAPPPKPRTLAQVEQRWFVGAHANVGGGYERDVLPQAPLKWMMDKAALQGLTFLRDIDLDPHPEASPVCDSYAEFMNGAYKLATLDRPFYRVLGQALYIIFKDRAAVQHQ